MIFPIYVPSKGRPNAKTLQHLKELKCDKYLFIEPQDVDSYLNHFNDIKFIVLEKNDGGVSYVRQMIKEHAKKSEYKWFWCIDDDVQNFHKTQADGKLKVAKPQHVLIDAQEVITSIKNIGVAALNFGQYAFGEGVLKKPYQLNKRCIICTLNNVEIQSKFNYDMNCKLKEDIDFSLQILTHGYRTMICNQLAISVPVNSTLKGGCYDEYKRQSNEKAVSDYLVDKWGKDILTRFIKKNGRYDVKINWSKFK